MSAWRFASCMAAILAILCSARVSALAAPLPRYGVFVYSSLCREKDSGDAGGFRIRLLRTAKADSLYFEWSEGGLYGPMLAIKLAIGSKTSKIEFTIPADTPPSKLPQSETYSGTISNEAVVLEQSGYGDGSSLHPFRRPVAIPRVKDSGGEMRVCKEP
jgi:hypothetical protein